MSVSVFVAFFFGLNLLRRVGRLAARCLCLYYGCVRCDATCRDALLLCLRFGSSLVSFGHEHACLTLVLVFLVFLGGSECCGRWCVFLVVCRLWHCCAWCDTMCHGNVFALSCVCSLFFFFLVLDVAEGCAFSSFVVYGTAVHGAIACVMVAVFLCLCLGSLLVCSGCEHVQRVERCPCCGLVCFWCTCCSTVCHDNMATSCRCFCWFFVGYFWGMNICCSV